MCSQRRHERTPPPCSFPTRIPLSSREDGNTYNGYRQHIAAFMHSRLTSIKRPFHNLLSRAFQIGALDLLNDPEVIARDTRGVVQKEFSRILKCGTPALGVATYVCECGESKQVFFTCKSLSCPSCGIKYGYERSKAALDTCLNIPHRHCTFPIPEELRFYFQKHRALFNVLFTAASHALILAIGTPVPEEVDGVWPEDMWRVPTQKELTLIPGIIATLHTFGRQLDFKPHIHILVTEGGVNQQGKLVRKKYIDYIRVKKCFRHFLLEGMAKYLKKHDPDLLPDFLLLAKKLTRATKDGFYVKMEKAPDDLSRIEACISYIMRYAGRPVIGNNRIDAVDEQNKTITWHYDPHEGGKRVTTTEPIVTFLKRLLPHIHDKGFNRTRYFGLYAQKNRSQRMENVKAEKVPVSKARQISDFERRYWRTAIIFQFGVDPLLCECGNEMELVDIFVPSKRQASIAFQSMYNHDAIVANNPAYSRTFVNT